MAALVTVPFPRLLQRLGTDFNSRMIEWMDERINGQMNK